MHILRNYLLICLIVYRKSSYECRDFLSCLLAPWHARFGNHRGLVTQFSANPNLPLNLCSQYTNENSSKNEESRSILADLSVEVSAYYLIGLLR